MQHLSVLMNSQEHIAQLFCYMVLLVQHYTTLACRLLAMLLFNHSAG